MRVAVAACLALALLFIGIASGRRTLISRPSSKPTKAPIVTLRQDAEDEVLGQKTAFGDVLGQAKVRTEGLDNLQHPKLRKATDPSGRFKKIPGRYIAVMKESAGFKQVAGMLDTFYGAAQQNSTFQITGTSTFIDGFTGFTAQMNRPTLEMVLENPDVEYVEEDQEVRGAAYFQYGFHDEEDLDILGQAFQYPLERQWHNDRLDQRTLPLDGQYNPKYTGRGVDVYVLDSGIRYSHREFGGRARFGGYDHYNGDASDWHGHGTHCAGLVGGRVVGTAREANLYSIRVLNQNLGGSFAGVIAGINHVVQRYRATGRRSVISMSLIGPQSPSVDTVITAAKKAGVVTVVAAGNFRRDACDYSPASSRDAITVGGTQEDGDQLYWFSSSSTSPGTNYGQCVDIFAPGQWIRSASHTTDDTLVSMSGTSMATPITAGAVALLLERFPNYTPDQIRDQLIAQSTQGRLDFTVIRNTPTRNRLVYVEPTSGGTTPPPTLPPPPPPSTTDNTPTSDDTPTPQTPSTATDTPTAAPVTQQNTPAPPTAVPRYVGRTTALPAAPSELAQPIITDLIDTLEDFRKRGFVPDSISSFVVQSQQFFSIVFVHVGVAASENDFRIRSGLSRADAISFISEDTTNFKPQIITPYVKDSLYNYVVMVNRSKEATQYFIEEEAIVFFNRWTALRDSTNGQPMSYAMLSRKVVQTSSNSIYISGVARLRSSARSHDFFDNFNLQQLYTRIGDQFVRGYFISDLDSYIDPETRQVRYAGIFSPERFGSAQYIIQGDMDQSALFNQVESFQKMGYHLKSVLSLPQSNYPYFLASWWR